jgi:hypothetical protein
MNKKDNINYFAEVAEDNNTKPINASSGSRDEESSRKMKKNIFT